MIVPRAPRRPSGPAGALSLLVAASLLLAGLTACTPSDPPVRIPKRTPPKPGDGGRSVLWIEPKPQHPLGALGVAEGPVLTAIRQNDGETAEAIVALRKHLDADSTRVRDAAITALTRATHADAGLGLLAAVEDPHPVLVQLARDGLEELKPEARDELVDRALRGGDPQAARGAARLWDQLVTAPGASGARMASLFHDAADPVARALMISQHCARLSPALRAAADASKDVAIAAAAAVCRAEKQGAAQPLEPDALVAVLASGDESVGTYGAGLVERVSHRLDAERAAPVKVALTKGYREAKPRREIAVAAALAALGSDDALSTLAVRVRGADPTLRLLALLALRRQVERRETLDASGLGSALEVSVKDDDSTIRRLTAEVAGHTRDGQVDRLLARLLTDPVRDVRFAAVWAIGQAKAERAIPEVVEIALEDKDAQIRDCGYAVLHHIVHGHPLPPPSMVTSWLNDPGETGDKPFWGRDHVEWRGWYQSDRR